MTVDGRRKHGYIPLRSLGGWDGEEEDPTGYLLTSPLGTIACNANSGTSYPAVSLLREQNRKSAIVEHVSTLCFKPSFSALSCRYYCEHVEQPVIVVDLRMRVKRASVRPLDAAA